MPSSRSRSTRRVVGGAALALVALAAFVPFACIPKPSATRAPSQALEPTPQRIEARPVRVLLVDRAPVATIACAAPCRIVPVPRGSAPAVDTGPGPIATTEVRAFPRGLHLGERALLHNAVRITPTRDGTLTVNGRRYRGELLVRRHGAGALSVVNLVPIERYLWGVLGSETYAGWPAAALEAQAIVSRTYTLWRMADRRRQPFDLHGTVADQSYLGVAKEDPRLTSAVDRTAGVVLLYQMKLFRCYYHSTCGGHTDAVENYFPDPPLLPLSGVRCGYCEGSKHYRWTRELAKAKLCQALRERGGLALARLASLEVTSRTKAGRVRELAVEGPDGARLVMAGGKFRHIVGARVLPSTFFEVRDLGERCEFRGRGWGHGVGLCQWGAKGMADSGFGAADILRHYYTGATLQRVYGGPGT